MCENVARDVLFENTEQRQQLARNFVLVSKKFGEKNSQTRYQETVARVYQALDIEIIICTLFFFIRMLFFRPRLNILIFLPILG